MDSNGDLAKINTASYPDLSPTDQLLVLHDFTSLNHNIDAIFNSIFFTWLHKAAFVFLLVGSYGLQNFYLLNVDVFYANISI